MWLWTFYNLHNKVTFEVDLKKCWNVHVNDQVKKKSMLLRNCWTFILKSYLHSVFYSYERFCINVESRLMKKSWMLCDQFMAAAMNVLCIQVQPAADGSTLMPAISGTLVKWTFWHFLWRCVQYAGVPSSKVLPSTLALSVMAANIYASLCPPGAFSLSVC